MLLWKNTSNIVWESSSVIFQNLSAESNILSGDMIFPTLEIEAYSGASAEITLPNLSSAAYSGASLNQTLPNLDLITTEYVHAYTTRLDLPPLAIEAYSFIPDFIPGKYPDYILSLPNLNLTASFGERLSLDIKLPELLISAYSGATTDKYLPELNITATATETIAVDNISCTLDSLLPPVLIETQSTSSNITIDVTLPTLIIQSTATEIFNAILNKLLPDLRLTISGYGNSAILDVYIPTLIMNPISYGSDYGATQSILTTNDRFHSILLRYNRWS